MYLYDVYQAWRRDEEGWEAARRFFRHARFKKGSKTTVQNSYQPTPGEVQLTQASADYARKVAPNAYYLNDVARKLLQDSLGTVQVDFNRMNNEAQGRLSSALGAMGNLVGGNDAATRRTNGTLGQLAGQTGQLARENAGLLGSLTGGYRSATGAANADLDGARRSIQSAADAANSTLSRAGGIIGQAADATNGQLGKSVHMGMGSANAANAALSRAGGVIGQAADAANSQLDWAGRAGLGAAGAANGILGSLANGVIPTAYQKNMEGSIRSALANTMGRTLSDLGNRGVLNSSVTTGAMNDIERNAADEVARQYQQNIAQVAALSQQQAGNTREAARDWASMAQQQNANALNAANAQANLAQQQNANTTQAAQNWANAAQQQNANMMNAANAQAGLVEQQNRNTAAAAQNWAQMAQQQLGNTGNLANALQNIYNTQHSQLQGALGQQANLAQQQWANAQGNASANSGLLANLANMAGSPIALAAAAQEAAQNPAFRAWNASMGLNGATTNALASVAGKGTSTQTTTQSGGPGFFGGLLGGVLSGAAQSYGAGLFCFPMGTKIKMADGSEKRIEHIEVGDKVMAWGENGEEEAEVLRTMQPHHVEVYNLVCSDAHTMATLSQPFLTEDGAWVTLEGLKMKQRLKNAGEVHAVSFSGDRWVYDLQVSGKNTYIADGFIAKGGDGSIWKE